MNKIIKSGMCLSLLFVSLSVAGCERKPTKGSDEFAKYLDELVPELTGDEAMDYNLLLSDPTALGIDIEEYELPFTTKEDFEEGVVDAEEILEKIVEYDYETLNLDQQLSYDVLKYAMENVIEAQDMYYLTTNYLDVNNGIPQSLPLTLYFFNIDEQLDLDSFIAILTSTPEYYKDYVTLEEERQDEGFGMSQTYMDEVIEQIQTFVDGDHSYIVESASIKIDALTFLSDEEKVRAKQDVSDAYNNAFLVAYDSLLIDLKAIKINTEDDDASLADYDNGQEYYAQKIENYTSFDDVEEYRSYLAEVQEDVLIKYMTLLNEHPELQTMESMEVNYTSINDINELIAYFETQVEASEDFPLLDSLTYHMEEVPESLQEIIQASAMYYLSPLDELNSNERLVLNGSFTPDDYNTIAHEGYPGHMYQHNYVKNSGAHIIRMLFANLGYSETWATYSSNEMNDYSDDPVMAEFIELNEMYSYSLILNLDLEIHYDNLSREEAIAFLTTSFGLDEESANDQYEQLLQNPGVFIPYYGYYYRFLDLKEEVMTTMGDDFSAYEFHKLVLDLGALPFDMLEERVLESIE